MDSKMFANCTLTLELKRSMKAIVNNKPDLKTKKNFKIQIIPYFALYSIREEI